MTRLLTAALFLLASLAGAALALATDWPRGAGGILGEW